MDRALASWVDMVWVRLRIRQKDSRAYAAVSSQRMDPVIWNVLEAELVAGSDFVERSHVSVSLYFESTEAIARVFYPQRFVGLCNHGDTPFVRVFPNGDSAAVMFSEDFPLVLVYKRRFCDVRCSFSYVVKKKSGATFFNAQT